MLDLIIDGQYGSTGKGKLAYYLLQNNCYAASVCEYSANAGHTVIDSEGEKHIFRQLPVGALIPDMELFIGPGAAINTDILREEIDKYNVGVDRLHIHPNAMVISDEDKKVESRDLKFLASTMSGSGSALSSKIMRKSCLASDVPYVNKFTSNYKRLYEILEKGFKVLGESGQGFSLSIDGPFYPYCTAKTITVPGIMDRMGGIHPKYLGDVYLSLRTYPIRVGDIYDEKNTKVGWSGPVYPDQKLIPWSSIPSNPTPELTTNTKRERLIYHWSHNQYIDAINSIKPNVIFLNFINYRFPDSSDGHLNARQIANICSMLFPPSLIEDVSIRQVLLGYGPGFNDMRRMNIDRRDKHNISMY